MRNVIDVSGWQEGLDYNEVKATGVEGLIAKISEGTNTEDTWWGHVLGAESIGIPWGVYCYSRATTPEEAKEEANQVAYLLSGKTPALGVWFDFEEQGCVNYADPTGICSAFVSFMNNCGYYTGIYMPLWIARDVVDVNALADYVPYWIAQYDRRCEFHDYYPGKTLAGWQYTDKGNIAGKYVDMNEWYL